MRSASWKMMVAWWRGLEQWAAQVPAMIQCWQVQVPIGGCGVSSRMVRKLRAAKAGACSTPKVMVWHQAITGLKLAT